MDDIKLRARAKINITLDAIRKMENGYHELEMIMQTVNLCDNLHIKKTNTGKVELKSNLVWLPCDSRNLVYRAAEYMRETYNIKEGIEIELVKNIPVAAGLAGGSSDCAATLVGINNLFRLNISQEELMKIGKSFGADVPYCILRGTALAEGIGEKLTCSVAETYELTKFAFELSEQIGGPVFVRLVTNNSQSHACIEIEERILPPESQPLPVRDTAKFTKAGAAICMQVTVP